MTARTLGHGSEVNGHVRRICDERALRIEEGAGKIETLTDVYRDCGRLQHGAHLLRDLHEPVIEELESRRIGPPGIGRCRGDRLLPEEPQTAAFQDLACPAGLDNGRGIRFDDERRTRDSLAMGDPATVYARNLAPAIEPGPCVPARPGIRGRGKAEIAAHPRDDGSARSVATCRSSRAAQSRSADKFRRNFSRLRRRGELDLKRGLRSGPHRARAQGTLPSAAPAHASRPTSGRPRVEFASRAPRS